MTNDLRNYKDNLPYILTSPEYQGPQPTPNGRELLPKLERMTAYVFIKATASFEDVNNLAKAFTDAFHNVNPLITSQSNKLKDFIDNGEFPFNKENNVYPLISEGFYTKARASNNGADGFDPQEYTGNQASLWTRCSPLWIGNLLKCLPANFQNFPNWKYQNANPYFYHPKDEYDYLKTGGPNTAWNWNNFIYGNMGVLNMRKCWAGDRLIRCKCWDGNTITHPHRDIPRPVVLNTQLRHTLLEATNPLSQVGGAPLQTAGVWEFVDTNINQYEVVFTNILYIRENLDLIQDAFRHNEEYMNNKWNPILENGVLNQERSSYWNYEMDIGMSDGSTTLRTAGQEVAGTTIPFDKRLQLGLMTPIECNWFFENPGQASAPPNSTNWRRDNGVPAPDTVGLGITPSQSFPGLGAEVDVRHAKEVGRLKVFSRWNKQWENANPLNAIQPKNPLEVLPSIDAYNQIYFNEGTPDQEYLYDYTESKNRNIGVIPAKYVDENGTEHRICGFVVSRTYKGETATTVETGIKQGTSTWELGRIAWGDFFGWSSQFGYDNPTICPMNPDVIQQDRAIRYRGGGGPAYPSQLFPQNGVNYSWVGANDAGMLFDAAKNRFVLNGLFTSTNLNNLNAYNNTTTGWEAALPQVGQKMATLNQDQADTQCFYLPNNGRQYFGAATTPATGAPISKYYNRKNQGVQDAQCGVYLNNIYFAPKGWSPPDLINPQNIFNPYSGHLPLPPGTPAPGEPGTLAGGNYIQTQQYYTTYYNQTTANRINFLNELTLATPDNWTGCMLDKMGFDFEQLIPPYGKQTNRFSPYTYGRSDIGTMYEGVKPLILNSNTDTSADLFTNVFVAQVANSLVGQPSTPNWSTDSGGPLYQQGLLNNSRINLGDLESSAVIANKIPQLFACPFYIVLSDICESQFQQGTFKQNCIFYGLKNYGAGQYFYVFGSDYSQLIDKETSISSITTEIRNPITGRLARLGKNSSIIYKIQRDILLPPIEVPVEEGREGEDDFIANISEDIPGMRGSGIGVGSGTVQDYENQGPLSQNDLIFPPILGDILEAGEPPIPEPPDPFVAPEPPPGQGIRDWFLPVGYLGGGQPPVAAAPPIRVRAESPIERIDISNVERAATIDPIEILPSQLQELEPPEAMIATFPDIIAEPQPIFADTPRVERYERLERFREARTPQLPHYIQRGIGKKISKAFLEGLQSEAGGFAPPSTPTEINRGNIVGFEQQPIGRGIMSSNTLLKEGEKLIRTAVQDLTPVQRVQDLRKGMQEQRKQQGELSRQEALSRIRRMTERRKMRDRGIDSPLTREQRQQQQVYVQSQLASDAK